MRDGYRYHHLVVSVHHGAVEVVVGSSRCALLRQGVAGMTHHHKVHVHIAVQ